MADAFLHEFGMPFWGNGSGAFVNTFVLNQAADKLAFVFQVPEAVVIAKLGIRSGTLTGTSPTYKISLQGVTAAAGAPDGTILGGGTPAEKTFTVGASNTWTWHTLDNSYSAARGDLLAIVIEHSSGTIDGSNNSAFAFASNTDVEARTRPYWLTNENGGGWTKGGATRGPPHFGYASNSKAFGYPFSAMNSYTVNTGSTPDEVGIKFTLPADWGATYKVVGARFTFGYSGGTTFTLKLYDSDGSTVLQSVVIDTDQLGGPSGAYGDFFFDEATLSTLDFGTAYRLTLLPGDATSFFVSYFDVVAASDWDAYLLAQNVQATQRTDAGAWTDTTTRRLLAGLLLADITEPAGGGGGLMRPVALAGGLV